MKLAKYHLTINIFIKTKLSKNLLFSKDFMIIQSTNIFKEIKHFILGEFKFQITRMMPVNFDQARNSQFLLNKIWKISLKQQSHKMHNYFQHMSRKQISELKQIVTTILEQPNNLALPKLDAEEYNNEAVRILEIQLQKRNTIITQFANMAMTALDEASRRISENEDLKLQYQQLAHKNKQDFMHFYQIKYENQQLKFHNFQLLAKNQQLSEERDSLQIKLERSLANFEREKDNWKTQMEKLQIELQKLERLNSFRKQNQEYTSKLKIQLMQLSTSNQKLKHELHSTRKKLQLAFEQLQTTKSKIDHLPQASYHDYRDRCGSVEIIQQPELQDVFNDTARRSSLKHQIEQANPNAPRLHHINKQWSLDESLLTQEDRRMSKQQSRSFIQSQTCFHQIQQKHHQNEYQKSNKRVQTMETHEQKQQHKFQIKSTAEKSQNKNIQIYDTNIEDVLRSNRYSRQQFQKNFKKQKENGKNNQLEQLKISKISRIKFLVAVLGKEKDGTIHQKKEKFLKQSKQKQKELTKFKNKVIDKKCTASTSFFTITRKGSNTSSVFSAFQQK